MPLTHIRSLEQGQPASLHSTCTVYPVYTDLFESSSQNEEVINLLFLVFLFLTCQFWRNKAGNWVMIGVVLNYMYIGETYDSDSHNLLIFIS